MMLEEPALMAKKPGIHGRYSAAAFSSAAPQRSSAANSTATAQDARRAWTLSARLVRMIGTRAPMTIPAASAFAMNTNCFTSMLPASRFGTTRMSALAATGHLAECGRLDGRGNFRGHRLHCREDRHPRLSNADGVRELDRVLADVGLLLQRRQDIDGGVGDDGRTQERRHGDQEAVAEPSFGTQAAFFFHHLMQQFVGVQAPLHQSFGLAGANHRDRHLGAMMAVLGGHDARRRQVDFFARGNRADLLFRADQNGRDQIALGRFDRPLQRVVAARVNDGRGQRRQAIARLDQLQVSVLVPQLDRRQVPQRMADLLPGRQHPRVPTSSSWPLSSVHAQSSTTAAFFVRFSLTVTVAVTRWPIRTGLMKWMSAAVVKDPKPGKRVPATVENSAAAHIACPPPYGNIDESAGDGSRSI